MIVRAPSRPSERTLAKLVTLVNSSDTTSGTRTIRIAFTQSGPSGSTRPASVSSGPTRAADTPIPAPRPTTSATRPRTAGDRRPPDSSRGCMTRYEPTVNATVASVFSHHIASLPPPCVMSTNPMVNCSTEYGLVPTVIGTRSTSCA